MLKARKIFSPKKRVYLAALGLSCATQVFVAVFGIYFPDQGSDLGLLYWEHGVLATGSPGKSPERF